MPYVGNTPAEKYASFAVQHFTTSATTGYTLDNAVTNENDIRLVINNVVQQPGGSYAYTASGTTLTLSAATTSSDTMYCVFLGKAVQTVNPGAGSVGLSQLSATGTASSSTFLRGDNAWQDPGGVSLSGSTNNQLTTVTGANAIQGEAGLLFDGTTFSCLEAFVFNDSNSSFDARFASDTDTHCLFVDGSANRVGIGESVPLGKLHIKTGDSGASVSTNADELVLEGSTGAGLSILTATDDYGSIYFGDSGDNDIGKIVYAHGDNTLRFTTNATERLRIKQYDFCVGTTSPISTNGITFKAGTTAGDDWISSYRTSASVSHYIHAFYSDAGGTQTAKYSIDVDGTAGAISDVNYKKNITNARNYLEDLEKIEVIKYHFKTDDEGEFKKLGFSAQQVETIFPHMINVDNTPLKEFYEEGDEIPEGKVIGDIKKTTPREVKLLKKEIFIPMLVTAVQELSAKVKTLETENTAIKARLTALENA